MTRSARVRALLATLGCLAAVTMTTSASADPQAGSSTSTSDLQRLAQQQTNLLLKYYEGQNVSPSKCGQGQSSGGVDGVFLLPVLSFTPGDRTINCAINARSVLVDVSGFAITEDARFPDSSYSLNGKDVPFTPENLQPVCDDLIAHGFLAPAAPATLDGHGITGELIDSGLFTAKVNRHAQIPGAADLYADSVAVGHPGRLATVFCGSKAVVSLAPGRHTIVVDYTGTPFIDVSTVFTYHITVKGGSH